MNLENFKSGDTVVTNIRNYDNSAQTQNALTATLEAIGNDITGDFLTMDILNHKGRSAINLFS